MMNFDLLFEISFKDAFRVVSQYLILEFLKSDPKYYWPWPLEGNGHFK
jgi:hypothetical protein